MILRVLGRLLAPFALLHPEPERSALTGFTQELVRLDERRAKRRVGER